MSHYGINVYFLEYLQTPVKGSPLTNRMLVLACYMTNSLAARICVASLCVFCVFFTSIVPVVGQTISFFASTCRISIICLLWTILRPDTNRPQNHVLLYTYVIVDSLLQGSYLNNKLLKEMISQMNNYVNLGTMFKNWSPPPPKKKMFFNNEH